MEPIRSQLTRPALGVAPLLAVLLAGCAIDVFKGGDGFFRDVYSYTLLDSNTIAVMMREYPASGMRGGSEEDHAMTYAIIDRKNGTIRKADSLPARAMPDLPGYFYGCQGGIPLSLRPPGIRGTDSGCHRRPDAISPQGNLIAYKGGWPDYKVTLFDRALNRLDTFSANQALEIDESARTLSTLTWRGSIAKLFFQRRYLDSSGRIDSAYLDRAAPVHLAGVGTRYVCHPDQRTETPQACWLPEGVPAFADSAVEFCTFGRCEWSEATRTLTRLTESTRFQFMHFDGRKTDSLDVVNILDRLDLSSP